jgi:hypothetical protein
MEQKFDPLFHQFLCGMLHQSLLSPVANTSIQFSRKYKNLS